MVEASLDRPKSYITILTGCILFSSVWCLGLCASLRMFFDSPAAVILLGIVPACLVFLIIAVPLAGNPTRVRWTAPVAALLLCLITLVLTSPPALSLVITAAAAGIVTYVAWGKKTASVIITCLLIIVIAVVHVPGNGGSGPRLLIFGIDAMDYEILTDLISRQKLPNISRLAKQGAFGAFETEQPIMSPVLWTTIATGKGPEEHGIEGFYNTSDQVRAKRIWDILEQQGWSVGVFRWLVTWPPPGEVSGFWVPDQMSRDGSAVPPEYGLINEIRDTVKNRETGSGIQTGTLGLTRYVWPLLRLGVRGSTILSLLRQGVSWTPELFSSSTYRYLFMRRVEMELDCDFFLALLANGQPDFAVFYDNSVDMVGHRYWNARVPECFEGSGEGVKHYGSAVTAVYTWADEVIGRILREVSPSTHIALVSDHGQKAADKETGASWTIGGDSVIESLGLSERVYVTVLGTRPYLFPVHSDEKNRVQTLVQGELGRIVTVDKGVPLFEVRSVPSTGLPYLALTVPDLSADSEIVCDGHSVPLSKFVHKYFTKTGIHDRYGVIVLAGPDIRSGVHLKSAELRDLVPTLLFREGFAVARDMPGDILLDCFPDRDLDQLRFIETYETGVPDSVPTEVQVDPLLKERLKEMGYLN